MPASLESAALDSTKVMLLEIHIPTAVSWLWGDWFVKRLIHSLFAVHTWLRFEFLWGTALSISAHQVQSCPFLHWCSPECPAQGTSGKVWLFWRPTRLVPLLCTRVSCFAWSHTQKLNCCGSHLCVKAKPSFLTALVWIPHYCKPVMNLSRIAAVFSQIIRIL